MRLPSTHTGARSTTFRQLLSDPDKVIFLLVALAFLERVVMFFIIGSGVGSNSDDVAYIQSGIVFANTGVISVWSEYPTCKIMPGMPVLCGIFSFIFGEGTAYINATRFCMIAFGCASVYVFYKCCRIFIPGWYSIFASLSFLLPNWAWSDNNILTEPPYLFFYLLTFYFTLRLGEESTPSRKYVVGFTLSFMLALMFRANILSLPFFVILYLLAFKKKSISFLLRPAVTLCCALLIFIIPWSIRNYIHFGEFIPISCGAANPTLLGTYQGDGAPSDEELDYETNVYAVLREQYPQYFNDDGTVKDPAMGEIVDEKSDQIKTAYRLKEWFKRDPIGLIRAYLISKPACMLNWVWCWLPYPTLYYTLHYISCINFACCIVSFILAFACRKKRGIMLFLSLTYWINLYVFAFSFASERYSSMLMPFRYMICAIGLYLIVDLFKQRKHKKIAASTQLS